MAYPGRAVRRNDARVEVVRAVQRGLNDIGCGPLDADGVFGAETESAVKLFQTRRNLQPDGVLGPLTWSELFGERVVPRDQPPPGLLTTVLEGALSQEGVREAPGQRNRGERVDEYISRVGLNPAGAHSWCQAFVYWCFDEAAGKSQTNNPCAKTAGVLDHWAKSPASARVHAEMAFDDPLLIRPGAIFVVDHGSGRGHTGIVTRILDGEIETIEGNTNQRGSREGDGVYRKTRTIGSINVGFVDYGT